MTEKPLINILIRTSNRPREFARCLASIVSQDYPEIRIIIGYDNPRALRYIPKGLEAYPVSSDRSLPYWYDKYLVDLMALVTEGYIISADDDDFLNPNVLSKLPLEGLGLIVQLQRGSNVVPKDLKFSRGAIGFPCIILHHSLKDIATISGHSQGDYFWIKEILSKVELSFVPIIVTYSPSRGLGKCNG